MVLKDIPASVRPREKLLAHGAAALADTELVALLLRTGTRGASVLQLAQQLLDGFGGLAGLLHGDTSRLRRIKGIGPAKLAELSAVIELARRAVGERLIERPALETLAQVKSYVQMHLGGHEHEVFGVLFLDGRHRLMCFDEMFRGTLTQTSVYPREIVKRAIGLGAGAVILAHNHPSGEAEPSLADVHLTHRLRDVLAVIDVLVLDHIVVSRNVAISLAERGLM